MNPALRHLQFWSLPGADYACIEPWTGANNAINTTNRVMVPPGTALLTWFRIELM